MNPLDAMRLFARVAELRGFTRAAESLGLPKSSASQAVQQLEAMLGTRLLHRSTRKVELSQDGMAFYERCKDLLLDMDELGAMFRHSPRELRGRLRVDMPAQLTRNVVIPRLPGLLAAHPGLELELSSTDRLVDLVEGGFDCVLRVGALVDSSLVARPLGHLRMLNLASPGYLAIHGTPRELADLDGHRLIHYASRLGSRPAGWEYFHDGSWRNLPMAGVLTVNNTDTYEAACVAGLGLIQAPAAGVTPLLEQGLLREVLPDLRAEPMLVSLLYAHRRQLSSRLKYFMDWLAEVLADACVEHDSHHR